MTDWTFFVGFSRRLQLRLRRYKLQCNNDLSTIIGSWGRIFFIVSLLRERKTNRKREQMKRVIWSIRHSPKHLTYPTLKIGKERRKTSNMLPYVPHEIIIRYWLTLSCRLYHFGMESSRVCSAIGSITSPRKSFLPNMSECQTLSHRIRRSISSSGIWNWKSKECSLCSIIYLIN